MTAIEGCCEHGARVRITDRREEALAKVSVWTCRHPQCMHEAFHTVHDHADGAVPIIVPLPPV